MIFLIKNEVLRESDKFKDNIEYLLDSFYRGYHIIDFENNQLMNMKLKSLFSENTNILKALDFYKKNRQNIVNLRRKVTEYIEVGISDYKSEMLNNQKITTISINYFDSEIKSCLLLSENLSDCDFYASMLYNAKFFNHYCLPQIVKFSFDRENGGGATTHTVLKSRIEEKRVLLCILDSDREEKEDTLDGTSGKVMHEISTLENIPKLFRIYILEVREKENLIPPRLYIKHHAFSGYPLFNHLANLSPDKETLISYIKFSENNSLKFKRKNSKIFDKLSLNDDMRGLSKDELRKFAVDKLYTKEFVNSHRGVILKPNEVVSDDGLINLFEKIPKYLQEDYKNIIGSLFSFTCSLGRIRL